MGYVQVFQEKDRDDIVSFGSRIVRDCGHTDEFRASGLTREEAWYDGYVMLSDECAECGPLVVVTCDRCGLVGCGWSLGLSTQHKVLEVV